MADKIFIPKKTHVGFQWNNYQDKSSIRNVVYITYEDEKGKLRKQTSWDGWRSTDIDPKVMDNVPLSGYKINEYAPRDYVQITHPDGHVFEIYTNRFLQLLKHCSVINGELQGEYVLAWSGPDITLLSTESEVYKTAQNFTKLKNSKVTKQSIEIGGVYEAKSLDKLVYLGKAELPELPKYGDIDLSWVTSRSENKTKNKHIWFILPKDDTAPNYNSKHSYVMTTGYTHLGKVITKPTEESMEYVKGYNESILFNPVVATHVVPVPRHKIVESTKYLYEVVPGAFCVMMGYPTYKLSKVRKITAAFSKKFATDTFGIHFMEGISYSYQNACSMQELEKFADAGKLCTYALELSTGEYVYLDRYGSA